MRNGCIPDDFAEYLRHLKEESFAGPMTDDEVARPEGPTRFVDIKVYDLRPGGQVTPPQASRGRLHRQPPTSSRTSRKPTSRTPTSENPATRTRRRTLIVPRRNAPVPFLVVGAIGTALFVLIGAGVWSLLPLLAPSATVTIVPVSRAVTATGTLTVVTGPANAAQHEIPGRVLGTMTMSQAERVPTTGTGHQDAQAASGTITLYNAAPYVQTVAAGTLLTGADGVQVVTDNEAVIPAAVPRQRGRSR